MTVGIMLFAKFFCILMFSSKVYQRLRMTLTVKKTVESGSQLNLIPCKFWKWKWL